MKPWVIASLILVSTVQARATAFWDHPKDLGVNPLKIDSCTSSPDGWWSHCCVEHDINYWIGGSERDRLHVDQRFYNCLKRVGGPSGTYFNAVRSFGAQSWNRAWPRKSYNTRLTENQCKTVETVLERWSKTRFFVWALQTYIHYQRAEPLFARMSNVIACRPTQIPML